MAEIESLSKERIEGGRLFLRTLLNRGISLNLAAWVYLSEIKEWRLKVVAEETERLGRRDLLLIARKIIKDGGDKYDFDEYDVDFEDSYDPVYSALAAYGMTFMEPYIEGKIIIGPVEVDAAYFYFTTTQRSPAMPVRSPGQAPGGSSPIGSRG